MNGSACLHGGCSPAMMAGDRKASLSVFDQSGVSNLATHASSAPASSSAARSILEKLHWLYACAHPMLTLPHPLCPWHRHIHLDHTRVCLQIVVGMYDARWAAVLGIYLVE